MTEDLLTTFNISLVVRGSVSETGIADEEEQKRYSVPKEKGIMRCIPSVSWPSRSQNISAYQGFVGCTKREQKHNCCIASMYSAAGSSERP